MQFERVNNDETWKILKNFAPLNKFISEAPSGSQYARALMVLRTIGPNFIKLPYQGDERKEHMENDEGWDEDELFTTQVPIQYSDKGHPYDAAFFNSSDNSDKKGLDCFVTAVKTEWVEVKTTRKLVWGLWNACRVNMTQNSVNVLDGQKLYTNMLGDAMIITTQCKEALQMGVSVYLGDEIYQIGKKFAPCRNLCNINVVLAKSIAWAKRGTGAIYEAWYRLSKERDHNRRRANAAFINFLEETLRSRIGGSVAAMVTACENLKVGYRIIYNIELICCRYTPLQFFTLCEFVSLSNQNRKTMYWKPTVNSKIPGCNVGNGLSELIAASKGGYIWLPVDVTPLLRRARMEYTIPATPNDANAPMGLIPKFEAQGYQQFKGGDGWRGQKGGLGTSKQGVCTEAVARGAVEYLDKAFQYSRVPTSDSHLREMDISTITRTALTKRTETNPNHITMRDQAGNTSVVKSDGELFFLTQSAKEQTAAANEARKRPGYVSMAGRRNKERSAAKRGKLSGFERKAYSFRPRPSTSRGTPMQTEGPK